MTAWYRKVDHVTFLTWLALIAASLAAIYSTTHGPAAKFLAESVQQNFRSQLIWAIICTVGVGIALMLPVRAYQRAAYPAYAFCIGLLLLTLAIGKEVGGATAWLVIGGMTFQASELAKVGTVMAVAKLLSSQPANDDRRGSGNVRYAAGAVALLVLPAVLIVMQNDTGTALVFLGLIPIMLFWSGLPLATCALMISPGVAGYFAIRGTTVGWWLWVAIGFAALFTAGIWWVTRKRYMTILAALFTGGVILVSTLAVNEVLAAHQTARIKSFTNPNAPEYRKGVGFHLVQSKAAIGSGGLWGKGYMEGTQTQGSYIPEQSTDFIFSVIGEEMGFVGSMVVLVLFGVLIIRLVQLGARVKHPFGSMVAAGAAGIYLIHVFVNVGMATGLLPVIGIPLPFVSYGGSAMLANTAMLAIVLVLHMRRDDFSIYGY
ncbi:MAG: rod shape-determining protein RodA [Bacteroidetes bacterium QS_7_67_15]|nr:MAG: rod shape-determining protein RodA [Bacteroidetes bacterium QS_7_67_15]